MADQSIIKIEKLDIKDLRSSKRFLFRRGPVDLYKEMYILAEDLAIHEMKKFDSRIMLDTTYKQAFHTGEPEGLDEIQKKISTYRDERLKFHMEQMKEILYRFLELEKIKEENKK